MTNSKMLREEIRKSGLKYKFLAQKLAISSYALQRKIDNLAEFKASEIVIFTKLLHLTEPKRNAIFFANKSDF